MRGAKIYPFGRNPTAGDKTALMCVKDKKEGKPGAGVLAFRGDRDTGSEK